jgi:hypothetical protein
MMVKVGNWKSTENCFLTTYHSSFTVGAGWGAGSTVAVGLG